MLSFSEITKKYSLGKQSVNALSSVSGRIETSEMTALCGPSGSGKSTLLNILGILDLDYSGQVSIDGQPLPKQIREATLQRRTKLGFIFQRFNLIPVMSALDNVAYPLLLNKIERKLHREKAETMLCKVGLEQFIHHRPETLSGGQQQRVAIARALVSLPEIVIADEPTASLDSKSATMVIDLMKELGHEMGTTFIIATHDARMAQRCDREINLVDGQLSEKKTQWEI
ncbi:ABC transporter ATP-binding protein [Vibrio spartinae]|uniref:Lipoprotein-releasing system ATP-binding protein LolD n=1 Tax=Vibrio spartinae TaxID=1918945 RepID=A0A1N6M5X8_9VIBR|nr:ABC transporter ATP-binding protein [Vibrio spartinae]SIO94746.1 Lipoprotein-releasing system ATP-binding protein LolD [Vibrio spartinae]